MRWEANTMKSDEKYSGFIFYWIWMQSSRLGESDPNRTNYKYENVSLYGQSFCHFGHFTQTFIKFMDPFCYAIHVDRGRYYYQTFFCRHTGQMVILSGNCLLISFPLSTIRQKKGRNLERSRPAIHITCATKSAVEKMPPNKEKSQRDEGYAFEHTTKRQSAQTTTRTKPFRYVNKYNSHCLISVSARWHCLPRANGNKYHQQHSSSNKKTPTNNKTATTETGDWQIDGSHLPRHSVKLLILASSSICDANAHNFNPFSFLIALTLNVIS